jgi:hypothetical protein
MSKLYRSILLSFVNLVLFAGFLSAQDFNGDWTCAYATNDDAANGTGIQTITVAVVGEDNFVAMVSQAARPWEEGDACYLVTYFGADSANGRVENIAYNTPFNQVWLNGFDQVTLNHAQDLAAWGNYIFVPNNDPGSNILVFEYKETGVVTHPWRMTTNKNPFGASPIWAIDVDEAGRVYVTTEGDSTKPSEILIYESPNVETKWSSGFDADPLQRIALPDNGDARGITVSPDGKAIWVSNYVSEKVYCYAGDADNGYTLYNGFDFILTDEPVTATGVLDPGPWGLQLMPEKNILFVACANDFQLGDGYSYGRYYLLNPNTGEILDTLDAAGWNFDQTGVYNTRGGGTASGYTSPFNIDFDENGNAYIQSFYGWTADKFVYSGTLPTLALTITSVEKDFATIPDEFTLGQNYPNPFNPSTSIQFGLNESAEITLAVYSLTGELVATLINSSQFSAGTYNVSFDASSLASGTYIYTISNGKQSISKKMVLLK